MQFFNIPSQNLTLHSYILRSMSPDPKCERINSNHLLIFLRERNLNLNGVVLRRILQRIRFGYLAILLKCIN